ncbi:MAG TPA: hypothetical protein VNT99_04465, partial [Methylomirabilota bacterium]|nr:hypothetical protein [Methylomirabilota bacterium]
AGALHKAHAASDDCYQTMRAFLDSSATSGSKSGTPGQPMPRDIEIRDRAAEMVQRFAADPIVSRFYDALRREAEAEIQRHRHEFEEQFDAD